jgi:hypothetical protein
MPAASKFKPSLHPRDRHGRFTRSRSIKASLAEKKTAGEVASGLKPKKGVTGAKAGDYLRTVGDSSHQDAVRAYTSGGYVATHKALRAGTTDEPSVKAMDDAMVDLPDDLILSRRVPVAAFGPEGPESLVGLKVRDAAYAPTGIGTVRAAKGDVRMRVAVPAGTRAAVNPDTGEVILDRDLEMVVAKVEPNSAGGHDMYLTVLPKTTSKTGSKGNDSSAAAAKPAGGGKHQKPDTEPAVKPAGKAEPAKPAKRSAAKAVKPEPKADPGADKPEGESQVRADLMKLKVPQLQAQMRERGLKPGRKRKSELVDALVADEMGHDEPKKDAAPPAPSLGFEDRVKAAKSGEAVLAAAPFSLVRQETHAGLGNRGGLPVVSREALINYRDHNYQRINGQLRDAGEGLEPYADVDADQWIIDIDKAMDGSALPSDVLTWRGVRSARKMFGDRLDQDLTGMEWREDAYLSTSADRDVATQFAGTKDGVRMRIVTPAGVKGVQVTAMRDDSGHEDEAELLLEHGLTLRVVNDRGVGPDGVRDLDVETLPKAEQATPKAPSSLAERVASGVLKSATVDGGAVADTRLVTFNDGSRAIQKTATAPLAGSTQKDLTDGEDLASQLGRAINAPVPEVVRGPNEHEVFMEYVPNAKAGMTVLYSHERSIDRARAYEGFIDSRDGRLLGVLDLITNNVDRHDGNWLVQPDGSITGIDHGLAWRSAKVVSRIDPTPPPVSATDDPSFFSPFAGRFFGLPGAGKPGWQVNDLTSADIAWMRGRIAALAPQFAAAGRSDWLEFSLARLDQLGEHAQGSTDRVKP